MKQDMTRRTVMVATAAAGALAGARPAVAQAPAYEPKVLGIDPKNIKGISEKLIQSHYYNNYSGGG